MVPHTRSVVALLWGSVESYFYAPISSYLCYLCMLVRREPQSAEQRAPNGAEFVQERNNRKISRVERSREKNRGN